MEIFNFVNDKIRYFLNRTFISIMICSIEILYSCHPYNNPTDPFSTEYQGFYSVTSVEAVSADFPTEGSVFSWCELHASKVVGEVVDFYAIQIADSIQGLETPFYQDMNSTSNVFDVSNSNIYEGTWFYRVRAHDITSGWGEWSKVVSFVADSSISSDDILIEDSGFSRDPTPKIGCESVLDGIVGYEIEFSTDREYIDGNDIRKTETTSYQIPDAESFSVGETCWWRIRAINSEGYAGVWSDIWSFMILYYIGSIGPAGGVICYVDEENEYDWTYIEAAPASTEWQSIQWGAYGIDIPGADDSSIGVGMQNTVDILNYIGAGDIYAAQLCGGLDVNGYDDWFLPSLDELKLMYNNLYIQGYGNFTDGEYWSSTGYGTSGAYHMGFDTGYAYYNGSSDFYLRVRAARTF